MSKNRHPAYYAYLYLVGVSGFAILAVSLSRLLDGEVSYYWVFLAVLTVLTSTFSVKIPEIDYRISIEDIFFFTNLILFGPDAGVITTALQGFMGSVRTKSTRRRLEFLLFNMGALMLTARISAHVFFGLFGRGPIWSSVPVNSRDIILPMCSLALVHYLSNSFSVAIIISLDIRRNVFAVWKENFTWTWITYLTGAYVATLIALNVTSVNLLALGATVPIVSITYFIYKTYRDKVQGHLQQIRELNELYLRTVESLALAADAKDQTTHGHIRRVRACAVRLAKICGLTEEKELLAIETGALLHDIGKLAVEDYLLNKPGRLNQQEFEKMKAHASAGEEILLQVRFPFPVAAYVRAHHERWDGTGYPDGLKGEEIPLGARILAIADAYDAIRSSRPYKTSYSTADALQQLQASAGTHFDPFLVRQFITNIETLEADVREAASGMPELQFRSSMRLNPAHQPAMPDVSTTPADDVLPELVSLYEFCGSLGRSLSLPEILANLEYRLRRLLPFDSCALFLAGENNILTPAYCSGRFSDALWKLRIEYGKAISGWVAAYARPIMNTIPALEFQGIEGDFSSLRDTLVVPMVEDGICLGTISLYAGKPASYSDAHMNLLQTVAAQAATLIAEARHRASLPSDQQLIDPVTGIYKARYLALAGTRFVKACSQNASQFHIICIWLNNISDLVQLYGSPIRDWIMRNVGQSINAEIRETDVLTRFGQDGFVLMLAGARKDQVARRSQRWEELISEICLPDGTGVGCQIGVACYPDDGDSVFKLLEVAQGSILQHQHNTDAGRGTDCSKVVVEFPARSHA